MRSGSVQVPVKLRRRVRLAVARDKLLPLAARMVCARAFVYAVLRLSSLSPSTTLSFTQCKPHTGDSEHEAWLLLETI